MPYARRPNQADTLSEKNFDGNDSGYRHNMAITTAVAGVAMVIPHLTPPTVLPAEKIQNGAAKTIPIKMTAEAQCVDSRRCENR